MAFGGGESGEGEVSGAAARESLTISWSSVAEALASVLPSPELLSFSTGVPVGHPRYHHAQSIQRSCEGERCHYLVTTSEVGAAGLWVVDPEGRAQHLVLDASMPGGELLTHAGGSQLQGSLLAVSLSDRAAGLSRPAEGCGVSEIGPSCLGAVLFYDVSNPLSPRRRRELDLFFDLCGAGDATRFPARDVQAVGFAPEGDGYTAVVLVSRSELQRFHFSGRSWEAPSSFAVPREWDNQCAGDSRWCWPASINLYAEGDGLTLLTFGREADRERVARYSVASAPFAIELQSTTYLNPSPQTHMGAVGGSHLGPNGALTVLAASEHFCDDGTCMCTGPTQIAIYASR